MRFEWDPNKASENLAKHKVDFRDAARAMRDDKNSVEDIDVRFVYGEERLQALCLLNAQVLFVAYTMRGDDLYHIIMARKADKHEQRRYFEEAG